MDQGYICVFQSFCILSQERMYLREQNSKHNHVEPCERERAREKQAILCYFVEYQVAYVFIELIQETMEIYRYKLAARQQIWKCINH